MTGHPAPRASGRKAGRRPKLSAEQRAAVVDDVLSGRRTAVQAARYFKVSEPTVSRILASHRAGSGPSGAEEAAGTDHPGPGRVADVLPVTALDERLAIVGTSGSGKTYAAKGLVENLLDENARVCVVDPLGVWWGLRAGPDGSGPGPHAAVVFGSAHADVPLTPGMGTALGHLVGTHALACVVDVSDLGSAAVRRAFTEALYDSNTEPLHLVLDEADLWAPQRVPPDGYDLLGHVEEIVRRGRVRGFVPWLITQRPAVLHKDVLSQADILVSMKLTSSQDRAALGRWFEGQAERAEGRRILAALPQLGRGEGWVWAPSKRVLAQVAFPRIRSFDSSAAPRRPERVRATGPRPPVDLSAIAAALAGTEGASPGGDEGWRISELERRLRQRDRDLTAALARVAGLEAAMQARLQQVEGQSAFPDDVTDG